ncbi:MAG: DUF521 domain-containing protein [Deltaproteobacteria bacterium]|nr:DUF521 domain-containing protein [Deltaproteobacteria bacterium]
MKLTRYEQEMLDGKHGPAKHFAMEKLVDFGKAVGAEEMVPVTFVLHGCPIYAPNRKDPKVAEKLAIYDLGHSPLFDDIFKFKDAHVADQSGCACGNDPYLLQLDKYEEKGYPWNFEIPGKGGFKMDKEIVEWYQKGYDKLAEHGWLNWLSCNPYFNTRIPKMGEYASCCESSAAAYINTILGARTNRENTITSLYAAYTGCLPKYGSHLDENRVAKCIVELDDEVRDPMKDAADWAALGAVIADKAQNRIMAVLNLPKVLSPTATKQLISCCSPGMNDPIMHLIGITPESPTLEAAFKGKMPKNPERYKVTMTDIVDMYGYLNKIAPATGEKDVDIVIMGCPHLTFEEVREIARLVKGKKLKEGVCLWIQTDTPSYWMAHQYGDTKIIEEAGGKIFHQTCTAMIPMRYYPKNLTIATDSFKFVKLGGGFGNNWIFGTVPDLINAATTGRFISTRW